MLIGGLGKATGTKVNTIRFYEQVGLLPVPSRSQSGQRVYDDSDVRKLSFIRNARSLGFSLDEIRSLIDLGNQPNTDCSGAAAIASGHLRNVDLRIERLQRLRVDLHRLIESCTGGTVTDCQILETMENG